MHSHNGYTCMFVRMHVGWLVTCLKHLIYYVQDTDSMCM